MEKRKKNKNYYVYKVVDTTTNQFYIGSRGCFGNPDDDYYMGSMTTWNPNKDNLIKEIIKSDFLNRRECIAYERMLIKECINEPLNENYHIPGEGFHTDGKTHSEETKRKIGIATKQRTLSVEARKKISENHKQKGYKPPQTQGPLSEETKLKISKSNSGKVRNEEFKKYTSERQLGENNHFYGKTHSEETKQKMREAWKRRKNKNYGS